MNRHVPYSEFRKNLAKYMDKARNKPVHIKRSDGSVVILSEEEFEGWKETIHLLSSPANAKALTEAIADLDAGKFVEQELIRE
jgi:antitoxin YefM